MTDQITLTVPRERPFFGIARLVLGGLAARLDVTIENLDDLELALEALLERRDGSPEVTVTLGFHEKELQASVGPFGDGKLREELEGEPAAALSLRRLLDAVVDSYQVVDRDGGAWVDLTKRLEQA